MRLNITATELMQHNLSESEAEALLHEVSVALADCHTYEKAWQTLSKKILNSRYPFTVHLFFFNFLFPKWHANPENAPAWIPEENEIETANIFQLIKDNKLLNVKKFHQWSHQHYFEFWQQMIAKLNIFFEKVPDTICDMSQGIENPNWLPNAKFNIAKSCFNAAASSTAIVYQDQHNAIFKITYGELNRLSNRVANSLVQLGLKRGDAIGIAMPMNQYAVAIYLGIVKMGGAVVSIADSFSPQEMQTRTTIAKAKAIFTQDFNIWSNKKIPLYEKVRDSNPPQIIVLSHDAHVLSKSFESAFIQFKQADLDVLKIREQDKTWDTFLNDNTEFEPVACDPMDPCNILFSSGTTAEPKAIIWNHTTPIKAASDAYLNHNINSNDIFAWPTNLGWMMGPWLIFATLINQATIALYTDAPKDKGFGQFIENAKVTLLGVVPTLVATWRQLKSMEECDWHHIKAFSSTGECSNPEDMLYLMSLAGYKPVIEYCGGTEVGGAYITSTMIEKNYPSLFSTPAMGLDIEILDENGKPAKFGEVAIIPPSIGLSTRLLNSDHYSVYYKDMPKSSQNKILRRHGDLIKQLPNGYYTVLGRADDSMNLGGIKISAAEIERTLNSIENIVETAAIAVPPKDNGPSLLIIFAKASEEDKATMLKTMQQKISSHLNPLFKIYDLQFVPELPKTASNKIMRRILRKKYQDERQ